MVHPKFAVMTLSDSLFTFKFFSKVFEHIRDPPVVS